ncbi:MAG TPA: DsbA family protein [Acidimicrobiales bacterium]|nr:DsbA family protein [Acidimicrobiales bacterium]
MSTLPAFEVSYDYLCPFAHIGHEHVVEALRAGAGWDVTFTPWTLRQVHKEEHAPDVWDDPAKRDDLLAMESSIVVRDTWPEQFFDVHLALFRARHEQGIRLSTREEVATVLAEAGADVDAVFEAVEGGGPRKELAAGFRRLVDQHAHFGVPTFVVGDEAVFVRLMQRPTSPADAVGAVESIVTMLVDDTRLNEFKRTKIPR